jgi:sec-independent protein translocase protein TatC
VTGSSRPSLTAGRVSPSSDDLDEGLFHGVNILASLDHLRKQLVFSLLSFAAAFVLCFSVSDHLYSFLMGPIRDALPAGAVLIATRVPEVFMLHLKMALFASFFLAGPVWLFQLWRFVGTIRPMRHTVIPVVFMGIGLFLAGAAFGHYVLFPYAVRFLTTVGSGSTQPTHLMLSVEAVFSFYAQFILGLGASFQIPTVVLVLSMLNLVTPRFLIKQLRFVILIVFTIAAILTPTPDMITQTLLALPMIGLYVISIGLCWLVTRRPRERLPSGGDGE